ncbi:MAG: NAD(P)-dependent oxidoreductase [Thaumarchaeota archaeon]|nr:MAG: NAD(P)-dependent oxidoreductase [Nitrososphaerota archaeon]
MKKLKILVIGGGGYIGSILILELIKKEFQIKCFDRFSSLKILSKLKLNKNIEIIIGDIRNIESKVFSDIDTVVDLAALTKKLDVKEFEVIQTNKNARKKIIGMSKQSGVSHFIRISSSNVYSGNMKENNEEEIPNPKTLYAKINLELDKYAISLNDEKFRVTVLRLASIFGVSPRMRWDQSINNMVKELHMNGKIEVKSKSSKRPFLHIKDAVKAIILVIQSKNKNVGEIFNVGSNDLNYSMDEIAKKIINITKKENSLIIHDKKDENSFTMNCDKINKKLGFEKKYDLKFGINEILKKLNQEKN